jgi:cyclophilin family peptidyl-prolyl cis-trans isomerase
MHSYFPHLNGRYSNFGKVVEGMDVVDTIDQGDKIIKVELK